MGSEPFVKDFQDSVDRETHLRLLFQLNRNGFFQSSFKPCLAKRNETKRLAKVLKVSFVYQMLLTGVSCVEPCGLDLGVLFVQCTGLSIPHNIH